MVTQKQLFILEGKLLTPLLSSSQSFKKFGCWIKVVGDLTTEKKPRRSYVGKLVRGERKTPNVMKAFRGFVKVTYVDQNEERGRKKIEQILAIDNLGSKRNLGFGKIQWLNYKVEIYRKKTIQQKKKFKIRKGLGIKYPARLQKLLIALMLHDFVHTEKHPSKIYEEIIIEDEEIREACLNHHNGEESNNKLLPILKYYDQFAAFIRRKIPMKTVSRYNYEKGKIDFKNIAKEIEDRQYSAYRLYNYIYSSPDLNRIVESMGYARNSIRYHLLLAVNLAINGYYMGTLKIVNGKIILTIKRKNSASVTKKGELLSTTDAEMHHSLTMNNADSKSTTNSMNE
ncbi:MAG: hypothetical protein FK732_04055 [Asgard group archaeon]|nr:hypothetical protein [Asgard group archaeon]